jgi:transcriptional regulator with XRE-family HTH domain
MKDTPALNITYYFGVTVRTLRQNKNLSQESFADIAQVHRTYISSIELGKVSVSLDIAQRLAVSLGVKLSDLLREVERISNQDIAS